jgi:hypothetical protein
MILDVLTVATYEEVWRHSSEILHGPHEVRITPHKREPDTRAPTTRSPKREDLRRHSMAGDVPSGRATTPSGPRAALGRGASLRPANEEQWSVRNAVTGAQWKNRGGAAVTAYRRWR